METEELLEFIEKEHRRLMKFYNFRKKHQLRYPITLKIMEELGELCEGVLSQSSIQREEKLAKRKNKLGEELADVLITTLLLGENLGVDIKKKLKKAIEKRQKRNY